MKVVINKKTGKVVYRQDPDFEKGIGIANALGRGDFKKSDLEEIDEESLPPLPPEESAKETKKATSRKRVLDIENILKKVSPVSIASTEVTQLVTEFQILRLQTK